MMTKEEALQVIAEAQTNLNMTAEQKARVLLALQVLAGNWAQR